MARGDHLYYYRAGGTYSHHGLDCGDGTVIHYESSTWRKLMAPAMDRQPQVRRTTMEEFRGGSEVFVRAYHAADPLDDTETALCRAESRLGEENYHLFGNNCEHFVVWCKTGVSESSQVNAHRKASSAVIQGAPLGMYLLRAARRIPTPYRGAATIGAVAVAGAVYLGTYVQHRMSQMESRVS
jgi:hypothetical protein